MNGDVPYLPLEMRAGHQGAQLLQIESSKLLLPLLLVTLFACLVSGLSLGIAVWAKQESERAQTRADLLQLEVESFKNVLHAHRLPTSVHLPGEKP